MAYRTSGRVRPPFRSGTVSFTIAPDRGGVLPYARDWHVAPRGDGVAGPRRLGHRWRSAMAPTV